MILLKVLLTLCLLQHTYSKFIIRSGSRTENSSICYSSTTEFGPIIDYWNHMASQFKLKSGACVLGYSEERPCSDDEMSNLVAHVYHSEDGIGALMVNKEHGQRMAFLNDKIKDELYPGLYNCSFIEQAVKENSHLELAQETTVPPVTEKWEETDFYPEVPVVMSSILGVGSKTGLKSERRFWKETKKTYEQRVAELEAEIKLKESEKETLLDKERLSEIKRVEMENNHRTLVNNLNSKINLLTSEIDQLKVMNLTEAEKMAKVKEDLEEEVKLLKRENTKAQNHNATIIKLKNEIGQLAQLNVELRANNTKLMNPENENELIEMNNKLLTEINALKKHKELAEMHNATISLLQSQVDSLNMKNKNLESKATGNIVKSPMVKELIETRDRLEAEVSKIKEEKINSSISHQIKENSYIAKIRAKDNQIQNLKNKVHLLEKANNAPEERINQGSGESRKSAAVKTHSLATTMATVVLTSLLSASLAASVDDPLQSTRNRPGSGNYQFTLHGLTVVACKLTYASKCTSWEIQMTPKKYPFFTTNYGKYSILEAKNSENNIIPSESENCLVTSPGTHKVCSQEASFIKKHCPEEVHAIFFINQNGKLAHVACPTTHVLTESCDMCIKKTKASGAQFLYKPIQDAFCQKGGSSQEIIPRYSKDICSIGPVEVKPCKRFHSTYERTAFIVAGSKKVYIEELKMRSRQEFNADQFLCYKPGTNEGERVVVKPSDCKGVSDSGDKKCTGDDIFCGRYQCESGVSDAFCSVRRHSAVIEININGMWLTPKCVGYEWVMVKRKTVQPFESSQKECTTCLWECNKDEIVVKTHGPKIVSAVACSHGSCKSIIQEASTFVHMPYPGNSQIVGGNIGIHMTEDSSPTNLHLPIHCDARDSCDASDCLFCKHGLLNYQCHSVASALIISSVLASTIALIVFLLSKSACCLKRAIPLLFLPIWWVFYLVKWVACQFKTRMRQVMNTTNNAIGWNRDMERQIEYAPRNLRNNRGRPNYVFYGVSILLLASGGLCCSESQIAESRTMRCTTNASKTNCKMSGTVILKMGSIGSESCLLLKGLRDYEKKFISIKTVASELSCKEGESYWTSLYSPTCLSSRRCHLMGECTGDLCLMWKDNKTSSEFTGSAHSDVLNENKCFEQGGGWGYGCFNVNPSCLFVHSYLRSVYKSGFKVFKCAAWGHRVKLEVTTPSKTFTLSLMQMSSQSVEWGSIGMILDSEGITGTNSYSFMKHGPNGFAIIDEPYAMEPRKGFLGEVRCPTEESAIKALRMCKVAPQLVEYQPETDKVECTTNMIDPLTIFNRGSLPQVRDGYTFTPSLEKTSIQAMTTGEIHASVRLVLDDYEVQFVNQVVNCEATFINLTGCYACDEGARLCTQVRSDKEAVFHLEILEMSLNMLRKISASSQVVCTIFHFSKPVINIEGQYDCGSEKKPMVIKGTLIAMAPHDDRTTEGGSSIVINPKTGSLDFIGWLSGLSSWLGGPLKAFFTILGFLIMGLILTLITIVIIRYIIMRAIRRKKSA
ncbi:polyprotein [Saint-Floris virus]|uniref:Envelopment polyprotein n=1 Tax=Saint-Floris virus TaxID=2847279 RepID=R4I372_9VIRU|nr:polyprotein [Saint-Floris virus]AFH89000.1 polyprotein [Saint-Floris virus]